MTGLIKPNLPMTVKMIHFHESADMDPIDGPMTVQFVNGLLAIRYTDVNAPEDDFFFVNPADIERMTGVRCTIDEDYIYDDGTRRIFECIGERDIPLPF